jgi:hypothetical protein
MGCWRVAKRLASNDAAWQGTPMSSEPQKASRAGGAIIAFSIIAGALIGVRYDQPSIGFVVGLAVGLVISLGLYLYDRR